MDLRASPLFMIGLVCNIQCSHQHHTKDEFSQMHLWNGITAFKYRAYRRDWLARSFRNRGIAKGGPVSDPGHDSSFNIQGVQITSPTAIKPIRSRDWSKNAAPHCQLVNWIVKHRTQLLHMLIYALLLTFMSCIYVHFVPKKWGDGANFARTRAQGQITLPFVWRMNSFLENWFIVCSIFFLQGCSASRHPIHLTPSSAWSSQTMGEGWAKPSSSPSSTPTT